jgi:hypothetical protein
MFLNDKVKDALKIFVGVTSIVGSVYVAKYGVNLRNERQERELIEDSLRFTPKYDSVVVGYEKELINKDGRLYRIPIYEVREVRK